jgi:hypothetical protein
MIAGMREVPMQVFSDFVRSLSGLARGFRKHPSVFLTILFFAMFHAFSRETSEASTATASILYPDSQREQLRCVAQASFSRRSLVGASEAEVAMAMVEYTRSRFKILSGVPQSVFVRSVTEDSLKEIGLGSMAVNFANEVPPLMVVIVEADMDVNNSSGIGGLDLADPKIPRPIIRARYVGYLVDLVLGVPVSTTASQDREVFNAVLNKEWKLINLKHSDRPSPPAPLPILGEGSKK